MWLGKRLFDFSAALIGLLLLWPFFLFFSLWIKLDSSGPIFFRQERVGLRGKTFYIHKFRTMYSEREIAGLLLTVGQDSRITSSGHFLRKYKLDEFPQLLDVIAGKMSLVGPRPEVPRYVNLYPPEIRELIFSVRPGITDYASLEFKDENAILAQSNSPEEDYVQKILPIKWKYHMEYAQNASFVGDVSIILRTLQEIFISR